MAQQPVKLNLKIYQGSTFKETLRWETSSKSYASITDVTKTAPVVVTAPNHSVPAGWRVKITGVSGMKELNTSDFIIATEVTEDTVTINSINATGYTTYTSGGTLEFNTPADLAGYTARMQIREKITSDTVIHELTTENGGIIINNTLKTITLTIPASTTSSFTFLSAVYSLELVNGGDVTPFAGGNINLVKEVTR